MTIPIGSSIAWCRGFTALALWAAVVSSALAQIPAGQAGFERNVRPFLEEHCFRCHGPEKAKAKLALHKIKGVGGSDEEMETWEDILIMIEDGDMPPDDEPQPEVKDRQAITAWIDQSIKDAAKQSQEKSHDTIARRLTNFEYENTMRDLLGVDLDLAEKLPKDPVKPYEFNNSAELMRLGPEQLVHYLESARHALASTIVEGERPEVKTHRREWSAETPKPDAKGNVRLPQSHIGVFGNGRGTAAHGVSLSDFPQRGPFKLRFKASAVLTNGATEVPLHWIMGEHIQVNSSTRRVKPVGTTILSGTQPQVFELSGLIENYPAETDRKHKGRSLPDSITITPLNIYDDGTVKDDTSFFKVTNSKISRPSIEWLEVEWPAYDTWPPESHTRILFESPLRNADPDGYVRQVLQRFMGRAYRRPATIEEVERFSKIYQMVAPEMKSFEAAMRETLAMVLISPQFLMHTVTADGTTSKQYALASRLSYFLWGSMPDDQLLALAASGEIGQPKVLRRQIERMIDDERFGDFMENFAMQWMSIEKMLTVPINAQRFPRFLFYVSHGERKGTEIPYRPTIRDYMIEETVGYIRESFIHNAGLRQLVDSDVAYLNQPLAAHYGVKGVKSHHHQMLTLKPGHQLGGLLTHGSVLIGNGNGSVPHPIYRAVWLREAILGEYVAPPPADIPDISQLPGVELEKALTIKDLLELHRKKTSCRDCHARLDPWGIPFEHYNAIGQYQPKVPKEGTQVLPFIPDKHNNIAGYMDYLESISTVPIEAVAKVPNGPEVNGIRDLKDFIINNRMHDVADNVTRRLLSYGLGRHLNFKDRPHVDAILAKSEKNNHRLRDLLTSICTSELFLQP